MRRKFTIVTFIILLSALPQSARAQVSAGYLYETCKYTQNEPNTYCFGFIAGVLNGMTFGGDVTFSAVAKHLKISEKKVFDFVDRALSICPPPDFDDANAVQIVKAYLANNAGGSEDPAAFAVWAALNSKFPCK